MDPRAREPDQATMDNLAHWADMQKAAKEGLREAVRAAKESGHSYSQIMKATGLSLGTVQRMVK